ncbi:hypothetical protein Moror_5499 [Moniliophthora roreri MCA 2997]|uniref:Uncharacterized protein n=1 Tax=Moniliophthora roreri (strain MCA 2997) TaxID=1381753 RepID=V2Y977_MONRO|nr:hypothetical protein Moror_5499 [Moniliophthora roreri MCA 2997]
MRQTTLVYLIFASSGYAFDISPLHSSTITQNVPVAVTWTRANDDPTGIALVKSISGEIFSDSPRSTVLLSLTNGQKEGVVQVTFFEADTFFLQAVQTSQNGSPARTFFTDHQTITVRPRTLETHTLESSTPHTTTTPRTTSPPEINAPSASSPDGTQSTSITSRISSSTTETGTRSSTEKVNGDPTESQVHSRVLSPSLTSPTTVTNAIQSSNEPIAPMQGSSTSPNPRVIAGSVVGSIIGVSLMGFLLWWYRRGIRRRGSRAWIIHPLPWRDDVLDCDESKFNTDIREEPVREERIRWHSDSGWRPTGDENETGTIDMPPGYEEAR